MIWQKSRFWAWGRWAAGWRKKLLEAGHIVTVWNRTPAVAYQFLSLGATIANTPREAVASADVVLSMVRDDAASHHIWLDMDTGALEGMQSHAIAVESSTLSPAWVKSLAAKMATREQSFVEAPVSGSRPQADAGTLVWFVGGNEADIRKIQSILLQMGSAIHYTGTHGSAAHTKLATNALMGVQVTAIAEIIGILEREGADINRVMQAISGTSSWSPLASGISGLMISENYSPQFPVELIQKDFNYILHSAGSKEGAPTLNGAQSVFQKAIDSGLGMDNMSGVVRLFR